MSESVSDLVLYGYWRSTASYRVRIALELKGLDYEQRPVHLVRDGGEQNRPDYVRMNPLRQVPTLKFQRDGRRQTLTQSVAIIEYLEERFKEPRLFPKDIVLRARVREIAEISNSAMQPMQNLSTLLAIEALGGERVAWTRPKLERGFEALEAVASKTAGRFAFGTLPTAADAFIVPQLYAARRFEVDLEPYPTLRRIEANCLALDAFRKAHPDAQPDAPKEN